MRRNCHLILVMWLVCGVSITGFLCGRNAFAESTATHGATPRQEVHIERVTPAYWRITFDNPPFNIFGPETIPQLNEAITQLEKDPQVKVVVFDSAVPGFFRRILTSFRRSLRPPTCRPA
jgi:hypothetical protein